MRKIGVVGVKNGWSSEKLADKVAQKTGYRLLIDLGQIVFNSQDNTVTYGDIDLANMDAIILKKVSLEYSPHMPQRLELIKHLETNGMPVFPKVSSVIESLNRLSNTLKLLNADIAMPKTVITEDIGEAIKAIKNFSQAIIKPLFSSKARGMIAITASDANLKEKVVNFKKNSNNILYIQEMVNIPERDLGVVFLGGKYISTYARLGNKGSWNTAMVTGSCYQAYYPDKQVIALAKRAEAAFDLDLTCVDVVETDDGPKVFEVSAFGGFRGLFEAHNIDIAEKYTDFVLNKIAK